VQVYHPHLRVLQLLATTVLRLARGAAAARRLARAAAAALRFAAASAALIVLAIFTVLVVNGVMNLGFSVI